MGLRVSIELVDDKESEHDDGGRISPQLSQQKPGYQSELHHSVT
jgi:hypothetical protein